MIPAATPTTQTAALRLYTTTTALPLVRDLAAAYTQTQADVAFDISDGNYSAIIDQLASDETAYFLSNHLPIDSPLWAAPIGQDGIAIIVHPENPVGELTTEQLRTIYQGHVTNWRDLGGDDREIVVISREDGAGTRAEFDQLVMGDRRTTRSARVAPSSSAMVTSVAAESGAIGYVSMSYLDGQVKALSIDGVLPTPDTVYDNRYPLRSTLFFVGLTEPQTDYRAFIAWVQSPEGQAVVAQQYAPLTRP
jgi:phosphate transport system substrate-binding protein